MRFHILNVRPGMENRGELFSYYFEARVRPDFSLIVSAQHYFRALPRFEGRIVEGIISLFPKAIHPLREVDPGAVRKATEIDGALRIGNHHVPASLRPMVERVRSISKSTWLETPEGLFILNVRPPEGIA
ncbi:MAG: hypothetical protein Q6373_011590, partial [Candidatus Sigynarchaeota archaeon]